MSEGLVIPLTVGEFSTRLHLWETTAPENYDGFGTFTVHSYHTGPTGKPIRVVAIQDRHVEWQTSRYHSGLGAARPVSAEDPDCFFGHLRASDITDRLLGRLAQPTGEEV